MQEAMERVRTEITAMEGQRAEALATITNLRAQITELAAAHVRKEEDWRFESDKVLAESRNDLNIEIAIKHQQIVELTQNLAAKVAINSFLFVYLLLS
jgi:hypothetical protein